MPSLFLLLALGLFVWRMKSFIQTRDPLAGLQCLLWFLLILNFKFRNGYLLSAIGLVLLIVVAWKMSRWRKQNSAAIHRAAGTGRPLGW